MLRNIRGNTVEEQIRSIDNLLEVATRRKEKQITVNKCSSPLSGSVKAQGVTTLFLIPCAGTLENFYFYNPTQLGKGYNVRISITNSQGGKFVDIPIVAGFKDRNHTEEIVAGSIIQAEIIYENPESAPLEGLVVACTFKPSETLV